MFHNFFNSRQPSAINPACKKNQAANLICLLPDFVSRVRVELTRANAHYPLKVARLPFRHLDILGAKNGTRTRDLNLGKVALYQLSYFRIHHFLCFVKTAALNLSSEKRDSDPRPQPWQGCALPTELFSHSSFLFVSSRPLP